MYTHTHSTKTQMQARATALLADSKNGTHLNTQNRIDDMFLLCSGLPEHCRGLLRPDAYRSHRRVRDHARLGVRDVAVAGSAHVEALRQGEPADRGDAESITSGDGRRGARGAGHRENRCVQMLADRVVVLLARPRCKSSWALQGAGPGGVGTRKSRCARVHICGCLHLVDRGPAETSECLQT